MIEEKVNHNPEDNGDDIDGCDVEFTEGDATLDEELPIAKGGINGDDIDGCDVEFTEGDATLDEELPIAKGGLA